MFVRVAAMLCGVLEKTGVPDGMPVRFTAGALPFGCKVRNVV